MVPFVSKKIVASVGEEQQGSTLFYRYRIRVALIPQDRVGTQQAQNRKRARPPPQVELAVQHAVARISCLG